MTRFVLQSQTLWSLLGEGRADHHCQVRRDSRLSLHCPFRKSGEYAKRECLPGDGWSKRQEVMLRAAPHKQSKRGNNAGLLSQTTARFPETRHACIKVTWETTTIRIRRSRQV